MVQRVMLWGLGLMKIEKRLFPYPVLCMETDDYMDCKFDVHVKQTEEMKDIVLSFEIELDNKELLGLIRNGQAEYLIHIECSNTSFRKVVRNSGKVFEYRIPKSKVNKEVYLVGMIVARQTISDYYSDKFNEDYDDKINLEKGYILAYRNLQKIIVIKNYEELSSDDAFFTIVSKNRGQDIEEPVTFDSSADKIKILVDEPIYNEYIKFHMNPTMKPIMITMLVMPALAYVIEEVRSSGSDVYDSCGWYQKMRKSCELQGKRFVEDIIDGDATSIEIAQEMLQLPIGSAFRNLSTVVEE